MNRTKVFALLIAVFAGILIVGIVFAQTGDGFDLTWHVISGGGTGPLSGDGFTIDSTLGQTIIGISSGGTNLLEHGFWFSMPSSTYLPIILK